jgi:cob(I)alamin adenosyltransferase
MDRRIFTGVGDEEFTATFGGRRVPKDDPAIELGGSIDFLLSGLDIARLHVESPFLRELIDYVEKTLAARR